MLRSQHRQARFRPAPGTEQTTPCDVAGRPHRRRRRRCGYQGHARRGHAPATIRIAARARRRTPPTTEFGSGETAERGARRALRPRRGQALADRTPAPTRNSGSPEPATHCSSSLLASLPGGRHRDAVRSEVAVYRALRQDSMKPLQAEACRGALGSAEVCSWTARARSRFWRRSRAAGRRRGFFRWSGGTRCCRARAWKRAGIREPGYPRLARHGWNALRGAAPWRHFLLQLIMGHRSLSSSCYVGPTVDDVVRAFDATEVLLE